MRYLEIENHKVMYLYFLTNFGEELHYNAPNS